MSPQRERSGSDALRARKRAHLELCATQAVEYAGKTTLFEEIELIHNALPGLSLDDLDVSVEFLGRRLRAPLLISGMTGGTADAFAVNRNLAAVAERCGIAFGLGSQRVMQRDPRTAWTFGVRQFAPSTVLLANLGLNQAVQQSTSVVYDLVEAVGADALCLHLNPAQELVQPEGDRDFRGGLAGIERLRRELPVPIIAKETGCGISRSVGLALHAAGISCVDVSGAGGTSWVRIETLRGDERGRRLGALLSSWGIPTAASLLMLRDAGLELIASGGIRTGLDIAKAVALGARLCGAALPVYLAYRQAGITGAAELIDQLVEGLKVTMLLTGSQSLADLARQPVILGDRLRAWAAASGAGSTREDKRL